MGIDAELKNVHKKLDDIEKKQEMMNKMYQLDSEKQEKMGKRPSTHIHEMTQKYIMITLDSSVIIRTYIKETYVS